MKVLVYGSGGRDHCLADTYGDSQHVDKVYLAPGNPGVLHTPKGRRGLIERIPIKALDEITEFCVENGVDLVDVGSENPLEQGLVDMLNSRGIRTVGPKKEYVVLESDRAFTDDLLQSIGVPKPEYRVFDDPDQAKAYVRNIGYQVVVKANGLAAGKGAIVCGDVPDAEAAIDRIMVKKAFGDSGNRIVVEERKYGTEISFFAYLDGAHCMPLRMFAQDYKQAFDPEETEAIEKFGGNLNTGGTGCYCPHKLLSPWLVNRIIKEIVNPTVNAIYNDLGWAYKGVIYFGMNLDPYDQLDVFEINVRHGDPEWQVIAPPCGKGPWTGSSRHGTPSIMWMSLPWRAAPRPPGAGTRVIPAGTARGTVSTGWTTWKGALLFTLPGWTRTPKRAWSPMAGACFTSSSGPPPWKRRRKRPTGTSTTSPSRTTTTTGPTAFVTERPLGCRVYTPPVNRRPNARWRRI
ncbi:MAG: phosphoribosylamine--glycine ligase [Deltaproteobacteria bacterium]|nr:phosphoribosylamine--glycine ligase [Deltaproteobacteria bacterium]